jgi:hypothetical protein
MADHAKLATRVPAVQPVMQTRIAAGGLRHETLERGPQAQAERDRRALLAGRAPVSPQPRQAGASSGVIQRIVAIGLEPGTKVWIVRSTSLEYHNARATIKSAGKRKNEYLVAVDRTDEEIFVRADQLDQGRSSAKPLDVDFSSVKGKSVDAILAEVRQLVQSKLKPRPIHPFAVGGSFAAFLHAAEAGQEARRPRDIDIIMDSKDHKGKPKRPDPEILFCGIPLELHQRGRNVTADEEEMKAGILSTTTLLVAQMTKLREQHPSRFLPLIPEPAEDQADGKGASFTAKELLDIMNKNNDRLMTMEDDKTDNMNDGSKAIWMKTLVDIEALAATGATVALAES